MDGVVRRWPACLLALAAVLLAAPAGRASSIVYLKNGDIYRASPGGASKVVVVHARHGTSFSALTQDDRGRLYAVTEPSRRWIRFTTSGRRRGAAFDSAGTGLHVHYDPKRNRPGFTGPLDIQASDDGGLLAEWGTLEELDHVDAGAVPPKPKYVVKGVVATLVSRSNRNADLTGTAPTNSLAWPSFLADGTIIAGVFDNLLKGYGVWYFQPGDTEVRFWFGPTNSALRLANPEVTRRGDFIAVTTDREGAPSRDNEIVVGHLPGPPPAVPDRDCSWRNPNGSVSGLTWSPDGRTLAWADRVGIWTARFTVLLPTGQTCAVAGKHLLAREATSPDWGPAAG
jgi:hypothetical protein